jgi:hypothetical protein
MGATPQARPIRATDGHSVVLPDFLLFSVFPGEKGQDWAKRARCNESLQRVVAASRCPLQLPVFSKGETSNENGDTQTEPVSSRFCNSRLVQNPLDRTMKRIKPWVISWVWSLFGLVWFGLVSFGFVSFGNFGLVWFG